MATTLAGHLADYEAALWKARKDLVSEVPLADVLSDLEEVAHALTVRVNELRIVVEATEEAEEAEEAKGPA